MPLPVAAGNLRYNTYNVGSLSIDTTGGTEKVTIAQHGRLAFIGAHVNSPVTTATVIQVHKNNLDTGATVTLPTTLDASYSGTVLGVNGLVEVAEGDLLHLESEGQQVPVTNGWFTLVMEH